MSVMTKEQRTQQDFVDNSILELIQSLNPSRQEVEWNIEMIEDVRDTIEYLLVEKLEVTSEMEFYPFIEQ